jgi:hypothetical protein
LDSESDDEDESVPLSRPSVFAAQVQAQVRPHVASPPPALAYKGLGAASVSAASSLAASSDDQHSDMGDVVRLTPATTAKLATLVSGKIATDKDGAGADNVKVCRSTYPGISVPINT